jgi:dTDP-4-amino-4,6-dideoxygalactose transaminase
MGITSLESLDDFVAVNRRNYRAYERHLADVPGVSLIRYDEAERCNFHYVILEIDEPRASIGRDLLQTLLRAERVLARRYFYPGCHRMEPYRSCFPHAGLQLGETERLTQRVLALPSGSSIDPEDVERVCRLVRFAVAHGAEIGERARLRAERASPPVA